MISPFHTLVAHLDYPMFIVTAADGDERSGCLVGFATQASIDPPRMVVMLSKQNHTYRVALRSHQLAVHFLHPGNRGLALMFGEETGDEVDKFSVCEWSRVEGVDPPILTGTRGFAAGPILERMDSGDHVAHLMAVASARIDDPTPVGQLSYQTISDLRPGHPA